MTYKLLWELVQHLKKRGQPLKNIKISHSSTRPARVCNLCYMLVVGEHELIEIEQKIARAQNIPLYDAVVRVPIDTRPSHRPALLHEQLHQWRLMFYINDIYQLDKNIFQNNNIYFQYKLHNFKSCFKVNLPGNKFHFKKKKNKILYKKFKFSLVKNKFINNYFYCKY